MSKDREIFCFHLRSERLSNREDTFEKTTGTLLTFQLWEHNCIFVSYSCQLQYPLISTENTYMEGINFILALNAATSYCTITDVQNFSLYKDEQVLHTVWENTQLQCLKNFVYANEAPSKKTFTVFSEIPDKELGAQGINLRVVINRQLSCTSGIRLWKAQIASRPAQMHTWYTECNIKQKELALQATWQRTEM